MAELDLDNPPEEEPKAGSRGRGRPKASETAGELERTIKEGLGELAEWLQGRDPELAQQLRDGAANMAKFLAHHAAKRARVARAVKFLFARGGPFAFLRSFGPTMRTIGDRLGAWRERREELEPAVDEPELGAGPS